MWVDMTRPIVRFFPFPLPGVGPTPPSSRVIFSGFHPLPFFFEEDKNLLLRFS